MALNNWTRFNAWAAYRKFAVWIQGVDPKNCPTWTAGSGAPTAHEPKGSFYTRTGGSGSSSVLYVATDSVGTWVALTGLATAVQLVTAGGESFIIDLSLSASGEAIVKLRDALAVALDFKEGANSYLRFITSNGAEAILRGVPMTVGATVDLIADPGDGQAIPVTRSGVCAITTAGSETRTLAAPSFIGQRLALVIDVDGGTCVVTVASLVNQTGDNTITMAEVKDFIELLAVQIGGAKLWRVVVADGAALSTV